MAHNYHSATGQIRICVCEQCGRRFPGYRARFCGDRCRKRYAREVAPDPRSAPASPWTAMEEHILLDLVRSGVPRRQIAERMGRSFDAVSCRIDKIRSRPVEGPRLCKRCGKQMARLNLADKCFACLEATDRKGRLG